MKTLLVQQFWLGLSIFVVALALWIPIGSQFGSVGVEGLLAAAILCLAPGCVVLVIPVVWRQSRVVGLAALAGGVLRLVFVLAGLVVVVTLRPDVPPMLFGGCVVVFYLVSLGVETWLIVRSLASAAKLIEANSHLLG